MALLSVNIKAFDTRGILSTPACDVHVRLKTNGIYQGQPGFWGIRYTGAF